MSSKWADLLFNVVIHIGFLLCYAVLSDKTSIFAMATEKEASILSAVLTCRKGNHIPSINLLHVLEELGGINAVNIMWSKSVSYSLLKRLLSF